MARKLLALEVLYLQRGQVIDSLMVALENCDTAYMIGFRGFERERVAWRQCEEMRQSMNELNGMLAEEIMRSRRLMWLGTGAAGVLAVTCGVLVLVR